MNKNVLCLPVPETYNISNITMITAHPHLAPWPKKETEYICFIKKGGLIEYVYKLDTIFDCDIDKINESINNLDENKKNRLNTYINTRKKGFDFHEKGEWRFYFCENPIKVKDGFYINNIRASKYINFSEIPIIQ